MRLVPVPEAETRVLLSKTSKCSRIPRQDPHLLTHRGVFTMAARDPGPSFKLTYPLTLARRRNCNNMKNWMHSCSTVLHSWKGEMPLINSSDEVRVCRVPLPWACFASLLIYCARHGCTRGETAIALSAPPRLDMANNAKGKKTRVPCNEQPVWNWNESAWAQHLSALFLLYAYIWAIEFYEHKRSRKVNFKVACSINRIIIEILNGTTFAEKSGLHSSSRYRFIFGTRTACL